MNDWAMRNHPQKVSTTTYTFPNNRECQWSMPRSKGKWVTKAMWICYDCKTKEEDND